MLVKFLAVSVLLLVTSKAWSQVQKMGLQAAHSRQEYCAKSENPDYFRSLFYSHQNLIPFTNVGGIMNMGVCWWHSMMTRNIQYLSVYRPELAKPSDSEVWTLLNQLVTNRGVVEIPGYRNFSELTRDHSAKVQKVLENWQIADGALGLGFLRGLSGSDRVSAEELKKSMDETYEIVKGKKRVAYQMLQAKGLLAHAWLVVDMTKTGNGYILEVVDSNRFGISHVVYQEGMEQLSEYQSVPYTGRNFIDYSGYKLARDRYCRLGITAADVENQGN
jgi:hypothetical protein